MTATLKDAKLKQVGRTGKPWASCIIGTGAGADALQPDRSAIPRGPVLRVPDLQRGAVAAFDGQRGGPTSSPPSLSTSRTPERQLRRYILFGSTMRFHPAQSAVSRQLTRTLSLASTCCRT